ncbi:DUF5047 domain-containing protein [Nonomuraea sp. SYSU D8015]|uniref:DUF5047 domain-containing protein n=1 Tax=Nonomuraea sp. SYSU D8015 TaxID=2593644 RepID=UPI001CB6B92B|nr:DUF5047 domain-containing protein [Nonomuraea sp. SYSU D8015]
MVSTFQTGVNPTGTEIAIFSGNVVLDGNADIRGTLDLTTDGTDRWPRKPTDLLAPYGNEIFVERGIRDVNEKTELVSLGYYRIYAPEQNEIPDGEIRLECKDRMSAIIEARLFEPRQFAAGTTIGAVFNALVLEVYPSAVIEWDDNTNTSTLARSVVAEEDRYAFLRDLATSAGKVMYFDHRGILVIKDPPNASVPVVEVNSGNNGVLVSMRRHLSREGVFNAVVAMGEATDTEEPVRAVQVDNNPNSPTYFNGKFGKVPRFFSSPFITTLEQAESAAASILTRSLGLPYNVDFSAVPNPALEPLDPVKVKYPRTAAEVHVIDSLTIPLTSDGLLTAATRESTHTSIGAP